MTGWVRVSDLDGMPFHLHLEESPFSFGVENRWLGLSVPEEEQLRGDHDHSSQARNADSLDHDGNGQGAEKQTVLRSHGLRAT